MRLILIVALLCAAVRTGAAEPTKVSEGAGLAMSLGGTAVSYGLIVTAIAAEDLDDDAALKLFLIGGIGSFVAPAAGHVYARHYVTRGTLVRTLGFVVMAVALEAAVERCHDACSNDGLEREDGEKLLVIGLGVYIVGTLDDLITLPRHLRAFNQRHAISVVPALDKTTSGFAIGGRF